MCRSWRAFQGFQFFSTPQSRPIFIGSCARPKLLADLEYLDRTNAGTRRKKNKGNTRRKRRPSGEQTTTDFVPGKLSRKEQERRAPDGHAGSQPWREHLGADAWELGLMPSLSFQSGELPRWPRTATSLEWFCML